MVLLWHGDIACLMWEVLQRLGQVYRVGEGENRKGFYDNNVHHCLHGRFTIRCVAVATNAPLEPYFRSWKKLLMAEGIFHVQFGEKTLSLVKWGALKATVWNFLMKLSECNWYAIDRTQQKLWRKCWHLSTSHWENFTYVQQTDHFFSKKPWVHPPTRSMKWADYPHQFSMTNEVNNGQEVGQVQEGVATSARPQGR